MGALSGRAWRATRRARSSVLRRLAPLDEGTAPAGTAAALQALASALSSAVTVDEVATVGAETGAKAVGASIVAIGTLDRVRGAVVLRAAVGMDDTVQRRWATVPLSSATPMADIARTGRAVLHPDVHEFLRRHPHLRDPLRGPGCASLAAFPLRAAGVVTGVVLFAFATHHDLAGEERSLLASAADLCGVALERARLYAEALEAEQRAQRSAALLSAVAEGMGHYLCVVDNEGRIVLANQVLARALGRDQAADLIGMPDTDLFSQVDVARRRAAAAEALRQGRPVTVELGEERPHGSGFFLASVSALQGPEGSSQGSITVSTDISQNKALERALATQADELSGLLREQRRRRFRAERLARLAAALAITERPRDVARVMVGLGTRVLEATSCAIVLRSEDDPATVVVVEPAAATDTADARAQRRSLDPDGAVAEVLRTGRELFVGAGDLDVGGSGGRHELRELLGPDGRQPLGGPTAPEGEAERGAPSWAVLPLERAGRTEGCLVLCFEGAPAFSREHRVAMTGVAAVCAQALWRTRRYAIEHEVAVTLQRTLLETRIPQRPGMQVAARYLPAVQGIEVGGDWYDVVGLADGRVAVVVGDVVGRGIRAAAVMGQLRTATRALSFLGGPADVLDHLDPLAADIEDAFLATVACLVLDPDTGELRYSLAGHPPPLVREADGRVVRLDGVVAPPLGLGAGDGRKEAAYRLQPGSVVLLYTDGLIERRDTPLDTMLDRLADVLRATPGTDPEAVCDAALDDLLGGYHQRDDIAVLCLSFAGAEASEFRRSFRAESSELAGTRAALRLWLEDADVDPAEVDDVLLAVGEAIANAVEHAGAAHVAVSGRIDAARELTVWVRDDGRWRPPEPTPTRGRGLPLMRALCDGVHVETTGVTGTVLTLRRRLGRTQ